MYDGLVVQVELTEDQAQIEVPMWTGDGWSLVPFVRVAPNQYLQHIDDDVMARFLGH